ncbi:MAG: glycine zipper family protein [Dehalococcoides mccartyi]|uniref:glycine zipper family protein n=1 Tax=Dehalococcoides TaxID=61434 RepID=UPI0009900B32|nr:glycine zipper family protein [Dehalococcoides mccartyi]AQU03562.1 glycine zipper family protein [Dehalococcoides mccartyi]AQU04862.1 glycine zipper family protein [Dehalococcoides mccartyi]MBF4481976.1 glycine zipper family protein [Dehalococcoides mccartyi]MBJ7531332.1 glycine zipper family protein [Dehalococcoides mccartyi]MCF7635742.1 glycine zipper family protein [Dehalococcoides mccartyi]
MIKQPSDWYQASIETVTNLEATLSAKEVKKYRLKWLETVLYQMDNFGQNCEDCSMFRHALTACLKTLGNKPVAKADEESYFNTLNGVVIHLQSKHKLTPPGENIGIWLALGLALGAGLGFVLSNMATGIAIGLVTGLVIGAILDIAARKQGRGI